MAKSLTARLSNAIGVTRVARITGLDRAGIEVAAAIRPGGHVLQVCNGKGETWERAALGAVLEAAELAWAERVPGASLVYASRGELLGAGAPEDAWAASELGSAGRLVAPALWDDDVVIAWRRGRELFSGREVMIPAQAVHCPPPGTVSLGPISVAWTTNGSGAHPDADAALLHALLEAAERDQLARFLPEGWTPDLLMSRRLDEASLAAHAPGAAHWARQLEARGFSVGLFDLTPPPESDGALGIPVAGALLLDRERGPVPLTAGYACRLERDHALISALFEAAQSRLTDIHGARDDVHHADGGEFEFLQGMLSSSVGLRDVSRMPRGPRVRTAKGGVRRVLSAFSRAGIEHAAAVQLSPDGAPAYAVKVVVPSFVVSELLL